MKRSQKYIIKFYEKRFNDTENDPIEGLSGISKWLYELYRLFAQSHIRNRFIQCMINNLEGVSVRILDIGCGGGSQVIAKLGCVVGVDLSINGLRNATTMGRYMAGTVADVAFLPFSDSSFDYVIKDVCSVGESSVVIEGPVTFKSEVLARLLENCDM